MTLRPSHMGRGVFANVMGKTILFLKVEGLRVPFFRMCIGEDLTIEVG